MRFLLYILLLLMVLPACSDDGASTISSTDTTRRVISLSDISLDTDSSRGFTQFLSEYPEPIERLLTNSVGDPAVTFNDSNYVHWNDAEKFGIEPLTDTYSHWNPGQPLEKVVPCSDFFVEPLTFSRPYLVPRAAAMLHEIGRRFNDSLTARGGGEYRIKVTSVLRTPETIVRLKRDNKNAIDSSVHQLATTFDISYSNFPCYGASHPRSMDDLKALLAEVLLAMREEGKIWVKYEKKQPCFHISARPDK